MSKFLMRAHLTILQSNFEYFVLFLVLMFGNLLWMFVDHGLIFLCHEVLIIQFQTENCKEYQEKYKSLW